MPDFKRMAVPELKEWLLSQAEVSDEVLLALRGDRRKGVQRILVRVERRIIRQGAERQRIAALWRYEQDLWLKGYQTIAGVDEAGRGPLAGPVVAAAVILPADWYAGGINDSKLVPENTRNGLAERIKKESLAWAIGIAQRDVIDRDNILQATLKAMQQAVHSLTIQPDCLIIDALRIPGVSCTQLPLIRGDGLSISVAAASILAKVTRDRLMVDLDRQFPGYGFARHKGYPTPDHLDALRRMGPCAIHRQSFIRKFIHQPNAPDGQTGHL